MSSARILIHASELAACIGMNRFKSRKDMIKLHLQRLGDEALAIGVALVVSTLVGLASAAWTMAWLMRRGQQP
jgi:hypothetical protein